MSAAAPLLGIEGLVVRFRGHIALNGVSLTLGRGEALGLVGESGSGKSTLLRAVAGLVRPAAGVIRLDGLPLGPRRGRAFCRRVQMVFQDPYGSLHPRQTIDRQLAEPLLIHGLGDIDARIRQALAEVGLPAALRFRHPHELSGGQRQRVAIARALMLRPELLLLDEPTSALDVSVQAEVLNLLADLRAARGLAYIMVSHNLAAVAHLCERIGVMCGGALVEELPSADLRAGRTRHPHTARLRALSLALEEGFFGAAAEGAG